MCVGGAGALWHPCQKGAALHPMLDIVCLLPVCIPVTVCKCLLLLHLVASLFAVSNVAQWSFRTEEPYRCDAVW